MLSLETRFVPALLSTAECAIINAISVWWACRWGELISRNFQVQMGCAALEAEILLLQKQAESLCVHMQAWMLRYRVLIRICLSYIPQWGEAAVRGEQCGRVVSCLFVSNPAQNPLFVRLRWQPLHQHHSHTHVHAQRHDGPHPGRAVHLHHIRPGVIR